MPGTLLICGLGNNTTAHNLRQMCARYGRLTFVDADTNSNSGTVTYAYSDDAQRAMEALRKRRFSVDASFTNVAFSPPQSPSIGGYSSSNAYSSAASDDDDDSNTTIFVNGLRPTETAEGLRALCAGYGRIVSAKVIRDHATGQCRGFGFVDFATSDVAAGALKALGKKRAGWAHKQSSSAPKKEKKQPPPRNTTIQRIVKVSAKRRLSVTVSAATGTAKDALDALERIDQRIASDGRQRRLAFNGRHLDHDELLVGCGGGGAGQPPLVLVWLPDDRPSFRLYQTHASLFDERYHFHFVGVAPDQQYRGGRPYHRPIGSMRYALKVLDKYDNGDNTWLGSTGRANAGEWPVAYHGTHERHIHPIVGQGLRLDQGKRFRFGPGIYCTPDPRTALAYAEEYSDHRGRRCKMVLQLRVDPDKIRCIPATRPELLQLRHSDYWILPQDDDLRVCAICIFPL